MDVRYLGAFPEDFGWGILRVGDEGWRTVIGYVAFWKNSYGHKNKFNVLHQVLHNFLNFSGSLLGYAGN